MCALSRCQAQSGWTARVLGQAWRASGPGTEGRQVTLVAPGGGFLSLRIIIK